MVRKVSTHLETHLDSAISSADLAGLAKQRVPLLPGLLKAYAHNGYFASLKAIVHFYNTRDVLPHCQSSHDAGEGTTCWPAPESTDNMNMSRVGRLSLSDAEEEAIVSFMQTLSDGFMPVQSDR